MKFEIDVNVFHHVMSANQETNITTSLTAIRNLVMATKEEVVQQAQAVKAKLEKIGGETRALLDKITELQSTVDGAKNVPQEIVDAMSELSAQADVVDNLNPDAPVPTPGDTTGTPPADTGGSTPTV